MLPSLFDPAVAEPLAADGFFEALWALFAGGDKDAPLALLIAGMACEKMRIGSTPWPLMVGEPEKLAALFRLVVAVLLDSGKPPAEHLPAVRFLTLAYDALEFKDVKDEAMKLCTVGMWDGPEGVSEKMRESRGGKAWQREKRRWDKADQALRAELGPQRRLLPSLLTLALRTANACSPDPSVPLPRGAAELAERLIELFISLESQLPTRRWFHPLLSDRLFPELAARSALALRPSQDAELFRGMLGLLRTYFAFPVDESTGLPFPRGAWQRRRYKRLEALRMVAFALADGDEELREVAMVDIGFLADPKNLAEMLGKVEEGKLRAFAGQLGVRTRTDGMGLDDWAPEEQGSAEELVEGRLPKDLVVEAVVARWCGSEDPFEGLPPTYPDEQLLFHSDLLPASRFPGTRPLPIPRMGLQFLSPRDHLLRTAQLFRLEAAHAVRADLEDAVRRCDPHYRADLGTVWGGWARMATRLEVLTVVEVGEPRMGETLPAYVRAEAKYDLDGVREEIRREWDTLRLRDPVFLLEIECGPASSYAGDDEFAEKYGIRMVRGGEVVDVRGEEGDKGVDWGRPMLSGTGRTLGINLDPAAYVADRAAGRGYERVNLLVRRDPRGNNFRSVMETALGLLDAEGVPEWLEQVLLGYGDPTSASYTAVKNAVRTIDFRDTFIDWDHLTSCFPGMKVVADTSNLDAKTKAKLGGGHLAPPYVLTFPASMFPNAEAGGAATAGAKRHIGALEDAEQPDDTIVVRTYRVPNNGPYPSDVPRRNAVRFTPAQARAIHSGSSPGLTLVVGPPGTGKTDVAVQIVANLYHNNPGEHILLVAHSNQALNQLFAKIVALDVDPKHLLRLGHGQEELEVAGEWGKYGRVDAFLARRAELLAVVGRWAKALGIMGDHGSTCETAGYFFVYHVLARWEPYAAKLRTGLSREAIEAEFPFAGFFWDAPQPLFPPGADRDDAAEIALGCYRHIKGVFDELNEIRAFELLRTGWDRSNYLLVKEARIVAMTCTHAALKRRDLVRLGFKYESLIMEEAAQILEIETLVPMLLQAPDEGGAARLKRVVLIGDHNQLPPVVQNPALSRYANMDQSMFARLVRLGVPRVELDRQGRARADIADLYRWRYHDLGDLPAVLAREEFSLANPGFCFDYQVVDVPDFQGKGEDAPRPYYYQNLGEAEYVVAVYQYMRLLGYPADKIVILTTYNGQKDLIQDVVKQRCANNPLFGEPSKVTTVDKYQGQQNDYVLLSLVRTRSVGHLRDVRRLVVALSRARLGLYIFCRPKLFAQAPELASVFQMLMKRPTQLALLPVEQYGAVTRQVADTGMGKGADKGALFIRDTEHMGQYAFEATLERREYFRKLRLERDAAEARAPRITPPAPRPQITQAGERDVEMADEEQVQDREGDVEIPAAQAEESEPAPAEPATETVQPAEPEEEVEPVVQPPAKGKRGRKAKEPEVVEAPAEEPTEPAPKPKRGRKAAEPEPVEEPQAEPAEPTQPSEPADVELPAAQEEEPEPVPSERAAEVAEPAEEEPEPVASPPPKGKRGRKAKEPEVVDAPAEEPVEPAPKPKRGRKVAEPEPAEEPQAEPAEPAQQSEPANVEAPAEEQAEAPKTKRGRKAAEPAPVEPKEAEAPEPAAKPKRGRKAVSEEPMEVSVAGSSKPQKGLRAALDDNGAALKIQTWWRSKLVITTEKIVIAGSKLAEQAEPEPEEKPAPKRRGKGKAPAETAAEAEVEAPEEPEEEPAPKPSKTPARRAPAKPQPAEESEEDELTAAPVQYAMPTSGRRGRRAANDVSSSEDEITAAPVPSRKRKAADSEAEADHDEEVAGKRSRKGPKGAGKMEEIPEEDAEGELPAAGASGVQLSKEELKELLELNVGKLKVAELREHLEKLGLPTEGLKAVLVARLEEEIEKRKAA
ncbi:intron-binding protein aquarius-like protein [Hyaloraphidium curvatum]|nr:intron-binding protein aquarius-like protein [Hyaloraphidium curvatum]